ncbi:MAG: TetR/AcrR family transcriptional regulator [Burkholderiaceae bacterium]|nr:TetR/AcrR family transcriptional regulator [Burkholderiaceae bacterium]
MPTAPPSRLTDRKRESIVAAAIAEFREHGFAGTSMDRIAAAAEVSKRTVYNHFPSKDELFAEILMQLWQRAKGLDVVVYDPVRPLREQLLALMSGKLRLITDASFMNLVRVAVAEMMHAPERAQAMVERLGEKEDGDAGLAAWIRAAQQDGRLRPSDALFAAHQLQALLKGSAFWPQLAMGQPALTATEQARLLNDSVDMFLGFYASPATQGSKT